MPPPHSESISAASHGRQRILSWLAAALAASALLIRPAALAPLGSLPPTITGGTSIELYVSPGSPAYVSGDLNDPHDPSFYWKAAIAVSDPDTDNGDLPVTAVSSHPEVVPHANLVLDASGLHFGEATLRVDGTAPVEGAQFGTPIGWGPGQRGIRGMAPNPDNDIYLPIVLRGVDDAASSSGQLVPAGAAWKYHDAGADLGSAWRSNEFDDSAWPGGPAQLGYGDGDEVTVVDSGPAGSHHITTYFRRSFVVNSPTDYKILDLRLLRDDGVVVYLNGQEIKRMNMPAGAIAATTPATGAVGGADESMWYQSAVNSNLLIAGTNVLAVETHQARPASSDISFDLSLTATPARAARFAAIGDYGNASPAEGQVASLVASWDPDFIITLGDNNYPVGAQATIEANIGAFYGDYITADLGTNRFWPSMGNHDWYTNDAIPYLSYFTLPGNERYYDLVRGPVHLFAIDSEALHQDNSQQGEPDGVTAGSVQGVDMLARINNSTACWQLPYFHHPPYSSGAHGSNPDLQWPFQDNQGAEADAVLAGHEHDYERVMVNGLPYFVNGSAGAGLRPLGTPIAGSVVGYAAKHGAMLMTATQTTLAFTFISVDGEVIDTYTVTGGCG